MEMDTENRLAQIDILNDLKPEDLNKVYRFAKERFFPKNTIIIKEGAYADAFYFILEGSATVFHKSGREKAITLATLHADDYFGEQGYLNNMIRTSSVKAATDIRVLEIGYDILKFVIEKSPRFTELLKKQSQGNLMANLQTLLDNIDKYPKRDASTHSANIETRTLLKNDVIYAQGETADAVYFVTSGSISLTFAAQNKQSTTMTISENHLFGEVDVINHKPRGATATAKTPATIIIIPGKDFLHAFSQALGLKTLINIYERIYTLPRHDKITEQFISGSENDEAIITTYRLTSKRTVLSATSINQFAFIMQVEDRTPDKTFHYSTNTGNTLDIGVEAGRLISIKAYGNWPQLRRLCELLINEELFPEANEKTFLAYLNPTYRKTS